MSTTTGYHEKCIDISLAVEMLHYATVPGAYDVAILVSGDKDFIPALSRIRQKVTCTPPRAFLLSRHSRAYAKR